MGLLERAPKVNNCCCFDLVTGVTIIGVCQTLGWFLYAFGVIVAFTRVPKILAQHKLEDQENATIIAYTILWLNIALCIIGFLISICLLVGVIKLSPKLLRVWLYVELLTFLLFLPIYFYALVDWSIDGIVFGVVYVGIRIYWWISVNSLHWKLSRPEEGIIYDLPRREAEINGNNAREIYTLSAPSAPPPDYESATRDNMASNSINPAS